MPIIEKFNSISVISISNCLTVGKATLVVVMALLVAVVVVVVEVVVMVVVVFVR